MTEEWPHGIDPHAQLQVAPEVRHMLAYTFQAYDSLREELGRTPTAEELEAETLWLLAQAQQEDDELRESLDLPG